MDKFRDRPSVDTSMLDQHPQSGHPSQRLSSLWFHHPMHPNDSGLFLSEAVFNRTLMLLPLMGYTLLSFALIDTVVLLIPPQPFNPLWILETMGKLVEGSWVPLLGFVCVFYGRLGYVDRWEIQLWRCLSTIALVLGLFYLLAVPFNIRNTWDIHQLNQREFHSQIAQQSQRFEDVKKRLDQGTTLEELESINRYLFSDSSLAIANNQDQLKSQLSTELEKAQIEQDSQLKTQRSMQRLTLLKQSIKCNLGALVAGVAFLWIWRKTRWARHFRMR